ncbi:MAG: hypothetical protein K9M99_05565 [Candidatus Cloacimonetes bacterium]|nr:hypothetical protein [Candidatus Cloacimonadota bacterium]
MKKLMIIVLLVMVCQMFAVEYKIELSWDQFAAECNGILSGTINNQTGMVQGINEEKALNSSIRSLGENAMSFDAGQTFKIDSEAGYFSFWIRDKFSDDDMNPDMTRLAEAKPVVKIWKGGNLIEQIAVPAGEGLVCKVFNLDIETGEIDKELRYFPKSRMIIGIVVDCVSGEALSDVSVSITDDMGKSKILKAGNGGIFTYPCEIGKYNLAFSKPGYVGLEAPVEMGIDEAPREIVVAMSEEIKNYRIVLTWGSRPRDLDAHLSGPNPDGGNFHIWWQDHYPMGGKDFLDRDDRSSYGPETITIYKPASGTYQYSVFDYSNRGGKNSRGLERSGARVEVYGEKRLIQSFNIPAGRGDCWHVFKIDDSHNIIPVNTIDYVGDDKRIHSN